MPRRELLEVVEALARSRCRFADVIERKGDVLALNCCGARRHLDLISLRWGRSLRPFTPRGRGLRNATKGAGRRPRCSAATEDATTGSCWPGSPAPNRPPGMMTTTVSAVRRRPIEDARCSRLVIDLGEPASNRHRCCETRRAAGCCQCAASSRRQRCDH